MANFVPPAYDLANLIPSKIDFKIGGLITAFVAFPIGALWVSVISEIGIAGFVNTLGAIFSISSVWHPALSFLSGYAWVIGAILGAVFYYVIMPKNGAAAG